MSQTMQTILLLLSTLAFTIAVKQPSEVRYEWKYMNFTWPSMKAYDHAISNGDYILKHNSISGVKVWKDKFYLTIPRLRPGIPVTLATIAYQPIDGNTSPNLEPYPNWAMQEIGNCSAFQFVQSIEIDPRGRLWVLDTGRINILDNSKALCPNRLLIFDLKNNNKALLNYEFPKNVANPESAYLNDIVLDHRDGGFAYITNTDGVKPSIIVFSLANFTSWQKTDESMKATDPNFSIKGDETNVNAPIPIDGITISPASNKNPVVYFSPLSSRKLFAISAEHLKNPNEDIHKHVRQVSIFQNWHVDGMIVNSAGELFTGKLEDNTVVKYNIYLSDLLETFAVMWHRDAYQDNSNLVWQDSFAIDDNGNLWVTSNKLNRMATDEINVDEVNFRLVRLEKSRSKSYQFYENGSAPDLPDIPSSN